MSIYENDDTTSIHFIGRNNSGQYGLNCYDHLWSLAECHNPLIKKVFMGKHHSIFSDENYENIWCTGNIRFEPFDNGQLINGSECRSVDYFRTRGIKIKHICASELMTFFITEEHQLYVTIPLNHDNNYRSDYDKLGINIYDHPQYKPIVFVPTIKNVMDVKRTRDFCVALCEEHRVHDVRKLLEHWSRTIVCVGNDIREMIVMFCRTKTVYSTMHNAASGAPTDIMTKGWNKIETLADKNIIQIACGSDHCLFLEDSGVLWVCGINICGCLGLYAEAAPLGDYTSLPNPQPIAYFVDHEIKICDINCGESHNLALDEQGRVYAWGNNEFGMCGDTTQCQVYVPHYVKTMENEHYLFGRNRFNECFKQMFTSEKHEKRIYTPQRITLDEYEMELVDIIPGIDNTTFICEKATVMLN
eukprot:416043_1